MNTDTPDDGYIDPNNPPKIDGFISPMLSNSILGVALISFLVWFGLLFTDNPLHLLLALSSLCLNVFLFNFAFKLFRACRTLEKIIDQEVAKNSLLVFRMRAAEKVGIKLPTLAEVGSGIIVATLEEEEETDILAEPAPDEPLN